MKIDDIKEIMGKLVSEQKRPVFHSEADFQFALAWQIKEHFGEKAKIRLEKPFCVGGEKIELDLLVEIGNVKTAFELKHYTKEAKEGGLEYNNEIFNHKIHSGQGLGRYAFLKDVKRLEKLKEKEECAEGFAILLTNDESFQKEPEDYNRKINFKNLKISESIKSDTYRLGGKNPDEVKIEKAPKGSGYIVTKWEDGKYGECGFSYIIVEVK